MQVLLRLLFSFALTATSVFVASDSHADASGYRGGSISYRVLGTNEEGWLVRFTVTNVFSGTEPQLIELDPDWVHGHYPNTRISNPPQVLMMGIDLAGRPYVVTRYEVEFTYAYQAIDCYGGCALAYFYQLAGRLNESHNAPNAGFQLGNTLSFTEGNQFGVVYNGSYYIPVQLGQINTIPLSLVDPDGDTIQCLMSDQNTSLIPSGGSAGGIVSIDPSCSFLTVDARNLAPLTYLSTQITVRSQEPGICPPLYTLDLLLQVTPANNPPTCVGTAGKHTVPVGQKFSASFTGVDPEGGKLSLVYQGLPAGSVIAPSQNALVNSPAIASIQWTPTQDDVGSLYNIAVLFNDVGGLQSSCTVQVQVVSNGSECQQVEVTDSLIALDGGAYLQNQIVKKILRKLKRVTGDSKTLAPIATEAQSLYEAAWGLVYEIPSTVTVCPASVSTCSSVSIAGVTNSFREKTEALHAILVKHARLLGKVNSRFKKLSQRYLTMGRQAHEENQGILAALPTTNSVCGQ